jgi:hypothetical protein
VNQLIRTSTGKLNVAAQLGIAVGIVIQIATGVDSYPTVPPGAVLAVVVAALLVLVRWRFIAVLGLIFPLWIAIGAVFTSGTGDRLGDPGSVGPFIGTLLQMIAVAVGIITGLLLTIAAFRSTHREAGQPSMAR